MLASKFCQLQHVLPRVGKASSSVLMSCIMQAKQPVSLQRTTLYRTFAQDARENVSRAGRRRTLKEMAMQPAGGTAINVGTGALAGGAAFGVGALCYYGLGLSSKPGVIEYAGLWPKYVKDRIRATYFYFGSSVLITGASAYAVFQTPALINLVSRGGFLALAASMAAMIGTGMVARSIPYKPGFGAKQLAWITHTGVMGAVLAPICFLGGPLLLRAAWLTAGVVGGLSAVAVCAPSDKFLYMSGPLAIGLGVVFASSLASAFLPPTTMIGSGVYAISMYGGLLLFSAFLLYDTQRIIRAAEVYPEYAMQPFDPVNASISIYLDTLNIFIRIATLLAGGGSNSKRR